MDLDEQIDYYCIFLQHCKNVKTRDSNYFRYYNNENEWMFSYNVKARRFLISVENVMHSLNRFYNSNQDQWAFVNDIKIKFVLKIKEIFNINLHTVIMTNYM